MPVYFPHYRKDTSKGITPPNPNAEPDMIQHITKHRGQKTPYTSVSESPEAIKHFEGVLYETDPNMIISDNHVFISHTDLIVFLRSQSKSPDRKTKTLAARAYQLADRAREALVEWQFSSIFKGTAPKDQISLCRNQIQKYFQKV